MTSPRPLSPEEWDAQPSHVLTPEEWDAQQHARPLPTLGRLRAPLAARDVTATSADASTPGLAQRLHNRSVVGQIEAAPGDAADMATEMARTPVQSILGMAKATALAPYLTGRYVGQQVLPNPNGRRHDVTGKEALAGAAMLAAPAIAPLVGAPVTAALTGAAFMPDKPFAGALIGAGLEGVHRLMPKADPVSVEAPMPEVPALPIERRATPRTFDATIEEGFTNARKALETPEGAPPDALSALRTAEKVEPAAKPTAILSPEEWNARQTESAPRPAATGISIERTPSGIIATNGQGDTVGGAVTNGTLRIGGASVAPERQGQGIGTELYQGVIDKALDAGHRVTSDATVELGAVKVYEKLAAKGYRVTRNPETKALPDGTLYVDSETPVFSVGRDLTEPVKAAPTPVLSPEAWEARQTEAPVAPPINPFREKATKARALADRLNGPTASEAAMKESFPLGGGYARAGAARSIDASVSRAVKAVKAAKDASWLEAQAAAFDEGKVNAQGRSVSAKMRAKLVTAKAAQPGPLTEAEIERQAMQEVERPDWTPPDQAEAPGLRTPSGRLPANLQKAPVEHLGAELLKLSEANGQDAGIRDGAKRIFGNLDYSGDPSGGAHMGDVGMAATPASMQAGGRITNRAKSIAKIEAELTRRGVDPGTAMHDAYASEPRFAGLPSPAPILKAFSEVPAVAKLRDAINIIVDPAARSPEAGQTAGIIRAQSGAMARTFEQAAQILESFRKAADKMPDPERLAFIDHIERAQPQGTLAKTDAASVIRKTLDTTRDEIRALGTGKLEHFITDYFPHIWEDPQQAASVVGQILGKRPLGGPASFLKERTIPTTREGIEAGLKPVTTNPVDLTLLKLREMQRYLMGQRVITEMKDQGLVKYVAAGAERPAGYVRLNDKVATVYGPKQGAVTLPEGANIAPEEVGVPGRRIMGEYWAPEPVARIVNNYLSPGLRGNAIYDAFRGVGNTLNQAQLGLSAFHLGFTSMDAAVSRTSLGIEQMAAGKVLTSAKTLASTPVAPLTNILHGAKVRAEYLKPGTMGGDYTALAQAVADAGGRVKMDSFYRNAAPERFVEAWRQNNVGRMALNAVPAFFQTAMKPIMEYVVPRQKLGVFADLAREALSKLPDNAPEQMRRKVMADAWDSVDNRLGQLVYDNLFWDKTFKDLAMASVRSVGWNLGTIREIGGGIGDAAQGKLTHRSAYIAALPITVGLAGAVTQYLYTGRGPQTLKDYFYPQTGTLDADGNPNRVQLPSYMKDVAAYKKAPWQTVKHKINPSLSVLTDMLNNEDFYGDKIYNEEDPLVNRLAQSAKFFGAQFMPFALGNALEERKRGDKSAAANASLIGVTPAPRDVVRSNAQNLMMRLAPKGPSGATPDQAEARQAKQNILAAMRRGEDPSSAVYDAMQRGIVNPKELRMLAKRSGTAPMVERFKRLPLAAAIQVFNASDDPREKELWLPILKDKASRATHP